MLKGHLPRVICHRVYQYTKKKDLREDELALEARQVYERLIHRVRHLLATLK